jgi:hypothetical protein
MSHVALGLRDLGMVRAIRLGRRSGSTNHLADVEPGGRDLEQRAQEHSGSLLQPAERRSQKRRLLGERREVERAPHEPEVVAEALVGWPECSLLRDAGRPVGGLE